LKKQFPFWLVLIQIFEHPMGLYELDEAFSRFIEFGKIFDRPTRRYLVQYLHLKLQGVAPENTAAALSTQELSAAQARYFQYLNKSLDKIFENNKILELSKGNERLTKQMIEDIIKWLRDTDKKIQSENPYQEEKDKFEAWSHLPTHLWLEEYPILFQYLSSVYLPQELDLDFYRKKIESLKSQTLAYIQSPDYQVQSEKKSPFDILLADFLAQWDALLTAKILAYQFEEIERERELFCQLLYAKVEELMKLLELVAPFAMEAGRYWDMSRDLWKNTGFDVLKKYAVLLEKEDSLRELVDMLGKLREAQIETEEEEWKEVVVQKEWVRDPYQKEEINGLRKGNDLSLMLPSEAALLSEALTETLFLKKYADSALLSFQYEGKKLVRSEKILHHTQQKQKRREKGPFIVCIDTSGSMHGLPAHIAKTLAFGILKMAAQDRRKAFLISFAIGIKTIALHDIANSLEDIVDFLAMSFDGGTDATPALTEALDILSQKAYKDADVLMVSDFVMYDLRQDHIKRIKQEQQRGTAFHSLAISKQGNPAVIEIFDHNWIYDPEEKQVVKQIWKDLQIIRQRET
jgi:uncharacterized protein with von Willebrand factor type A (vWA) domain